MKLSPANYFLNSAFFFLLFLVPFTTIRLYFYFNYYFSTHEFFLTDLLWLLIRGWWFDLCVIGFLLTPVFMLYLLSYIKKIRNLCFLTIGGYKSLMWIFILSVLYLNIPFLATNIPFDLVEWMRWPDYQSLLFINCTQCYWHYGYLSAVHPLQIIVGLMCFLIWIAVFAQWNYFSESMNIRRELLFFILLAVMARGKVGHHHLRYEDSVWHKEPLMNSLSNNPLWLMDKPKN